MVIVAADSNAVFQDVEDYETNKAIVAQWVIDNDIKAVIGPLIPELGLKLAPELRLGGPSYLRKRRTSFRISGECPLLI